MSNKINVLKDMHNNIITRVMAIWSKMGDKFTLEIISEILYLCISMR